MDADIIKAIITEYKNDFQRLDSEERYKWEAIKCFQDNWNPEAANFEDMLKAATAKAKNLLDSQSVFPRGMILEYAHNFPEETRQWFIALFDETAPLLERIQNFVKTAEVLNKKFFGDQAEEKAHYQDQHAISVYLTFRYPEKYYFYKRRMFVSVAQRIGYDNIPKQGKIETLPAYFEMANEIRQVVLQDDDLKKLSQSRLNDVCYSDGDCTVLTQDLILFASRQNETLVDENIFVPDAQFFVCSVGQPGKDYTEDNLQKCIEQKAHIMHEGTKSDLKGDFAAIRKDDIILLKYAGKIVAWGKATGTVAPNDGTEDHWNNKIYVDEWHFYSDNHVDGPGIYGINSACVTGTINYAVVRQVTSKWAVSKLKDFSNAGDLLADFKTPVQTNENTDEVSKMEKKIPYALNTIFYGPPGTGKTRILLDEIAKEYFYKQVGQLTEAERNANVVADLNWWEVVALCLLDNGGSAKVPKIMEHPLIAAHLKNSNNQRPAHAVWGQLQIHTKEDCEYVKYDLTRRAEPKVFSKSQDSTWTVDRDLLTENRPELLERLKQYHTAAGVSEIKRYQFVTFHQSYSYENFVEGISAETDEDDNIHYKVKTGIFKDFCQTAQDNPDHKYALFIDEINRGNVSGVFGELISLIEADKRGKLHTTLPYSKTDFYVPENLYIFGSMNTADRSIDALDSALRRRFAFVEMPPKPELLNSDKFKTKHISVDLCALLKALNRRVEFLLDRDHKIGHSYFMTIQAETAEEELANLQASFKNQIIPLLEDYFYGNLEKVQMVLGHKFIVPDEEQELTSACLMCGEDAVEFQDKISLKVADISTLTEADFAELIK